MVAEVSKDGMLVVVILTRPNSHQPPLVAAAWSRKTRVPIRYRSCSCGVWQEMDVICNLLLSRPKFTVKSQKCQSKQQPTSSVTGLVISQSSTMPDWRWLGRFLQTAGFHTRARAFIMIPNAHLSGKVTCSRSHFQGHRLES